ncbi:hypothetical protein [Arenimonas sp.]|uniref:hypothetical protein n=1 Tax=Arenimonas sp. TaxID=1872635 RepID=UPI0039E4232B
MKTLQFSGYSDDTFGEISPRGDDYDNCASGKPIEWVVESASEANALLVVGQHCPGNARGWLIGVSPYDPKDNEAEPPAWPIRMKPGEREYSLVLEIDAPDDATIRCLQRTDDDD